MIFKLAHLCTFIFALAKVFAIAPMVNWSWWLVLAPSLVCFAIGFAIIGIAYIAVKG